MKSINKWILFILSFIIISCNSAKKSTTYTKPLYQTSSLVITQISNNTFEHTSYLKTNDFGLVPCNGLIVRDNDEVIIFDTPADNKSAEELIKWIENSLKCKVVAIIPTHFHEDCLGGLKAFHDKGIPSYAFYKTIELAKTNNVEVPKNGFNDSLILNVGNKHVSAKFFGEGHTKDNIVGYFPSENVMFGGCLIKELNASKGNLQDANVNAWSETVEKVKNAYPNVKVVVPGHGKFGNAVLLDYTIDLFNIQ